MSYPHYDTDYLLDQYYFQPSISGNSTGITEAHYLPQSEFYCNWVPAGVYLQQTNSTTEADSQQQLLGCSFKAPENSRWLPENSGTSATAYFCTTNRFEVSSGNAKNYTCPNCHKQYCRKSTLKAHLKQHLDYRPFICQICGKSFSQAANLTAHKRVHTGEKPFSCPICLRPFSQSSSLVTHKRTHTGERPYPCAHCDKAFTDSSTLTKHLRTHTGQKPYQCHLCLMRFTQSGNLHRHMKTHRSQQQ